MGAATAVTGDVPVQPAAQPGREADGSLPDEPEQAEPGVDRILTVPNGITVVRLACIPLFLWLLFGDERQTAAAILLGARGATDWIDGFVARRYHQVSTVGKVLDPVADRVLVVTAVIAIAVQGAVPIWFAVATLAELGLVLAVISVLVNLAARAIITRSSALGPSVGPN